MAKTNKIPTTRAAAKPKTAGKPTPAKKDFETLARSKGFIKKMTLDEWASSAPAATPKTGPEVPAFPNVSHPKHYNEHPSGVECIDIIQHFNFNMGASIKHLWRAGLKGGTKELQLEDLRKARQYIDFEIARVTNFG